MGEVRGLRLQDFFLVAAPTLLSQVNDPEKAMRILQ
jgi:hypothetical protein